jgi:hypothetical protein
MFFLQSLMVVNFNQVFNMGTNAGRLKFLSLDPKKKVECYNEYFINVYLYFVND